jgi:hypothetical protein
MIRVATKNSQDDAKNAADVPSPSKALPHLPMMEEELYLLCSVGDMDCCKIECSLVEDVD